MLAYALAGEVGVSGQTNVENGLVLGIDVPVERKVRCELSWLWLSQLYQGEFPGRPTYPEHGWGGLRGLHGLPPRADYSL